MSVLERDDAPPARVIEVVEPSVGLDAVVVIDHELFATAVGGTRMVPDVTSDEVARLARAMTWKLAVCGVSYAGAKAGIRFSGGDRAAVLGAFLDRVREWQDFFLTGPDIGTQPRGLPRARAGGRPHARLGAHARGDGDGRPRGRLRDQGGGGRRARTARPALRGRAAWRSRASARPAPAPPAPAGTPARASWRSARSRARSSTRAGSTWTSCSRSAPGTAMRSSTTGTSRTAARGALRRRCDVLVPGARPHVILPESVTELRCAAVVPTANVPYAPGAADALAAGGILALPDFVTNAGGIHLYEAPECQEDPARCLAAVERLVAETTRRVLAAADADRVTPTQAALEIARAFLRTAVAERSRD